MTSHLLRDIKSSYGATQPALTPQNLT